MTRARILADYVSSGDELAAVATTANGALQRSGGVMTGAITTNSTFDGVDIATAVAANTAKVTNSTDASDLASGTVPDARFPNTLPAASGANLTAVPADELSGTITSATQDAITRLGTVTSGVLEDAVTYRNINQDLASTDSPTFNNLSVSQIEGNTHYRSNFIDVFPKYGGAGAAYSANSVWYNIGSIQGRYASGKGHLESLMVAPPSGFTEAFYITVIGGTGSGSGVGYFKLTDSTGAYDGISSTYFADGYYAYAAHFSKTMLVGTFNSVTLRNALLPNLSVVNMWIRNTGSSGYAGVSRVVLEQRIYFS